MCTLYYFSWLFSAKEMDFPKVGSDNRLVF